MKISRMVSMGIVLKWICRPYIHIISRILPLVDGGCPFLGVSEGTSSYTVNGIWKSREFVGINQWLRSFGWGFIGESNVCSRRKVCVCVFVCVSVWVCVWLWVWVFRLWTRLFIRNRFIRNKTLQGRKMKKIRGLSSKILETFSRGKKSAYFLPIQRENFQN